jgi:hypothetical protein
MAGPIKLVDMAQAPEKNEKLSGANVGAPGISPYSYEHKIGLNTKDLNNLGMQGPHKVGDKVILHAEGEIASVASHQTDADEGTTHHIQIQLKKMGVQPKLGGGGSIADAVNQGIKQGSQQND